MSGPGNTGGSTDPQHWFTTTHWSVVLAARDPSPESAAALESLCRAYWSPLYTYIRRRGHDVHAAQDLAQQFIAHLLARDFLSGVDPGKGRFRSFLLASLNHFLISEHKRTNAQKRGGSVNFVPIDAGDTEQWLDAEAATTCTPQDAFDRRWALTLLEKGFHRMQNEFAAEGKLAQFERLKVFLEGDVSHGDYNRAAGELQMSPNAVGVAVHRLRQRYREHLRREIAETVGDPGEVESELREVLAALSR